MFSEIFKSLKETFNSFFDQRHYKPVHIALYIVLLIPGFVIGIYFNYIIILYLGWFKYIGYMLIIILCCASCAIIDSNVKTNVEK